MRLARSIVIISIAILLSWSFYIHKWTYTAGGFALFSWDAGGYYSYLPAFFYDDLYAPEKVGHEIRDRQLMGGMLPYHYHPETGRAVMRYPIGTAIAFSPGFLVAHVLAAERDGFGETYTFCIALWGLLIAIAGLLLLFRLLCRYFSATPSAVLLLSYVFATNYLHFASVELLHPHSLLFTLYALLMYMADDYYRSPRPRPWLLWAMGLLSGFMAIIRPTDALSILVPLFWGAHSARIFWQRIRYWLAHPSLLLLLAGGVVLTVSIQMIYWQLCTGHWIYNSYREQLGFSFLHPHTWDYLFSYRKGWWMYTPFMILAVPGLWMTLRLRKYHAFVITIYTILMIYMLSSWDVWWYGGSFSQRSIVQSYALLAFPVGYIIERAFAKKAFRILFWLLLLFLGYTNINLHWLASKSQYYETDDMNRGYFWKTIWTWDRDLSYRRFLDLEYEMPEEKLAELRLLAQQDFENWKGADTLNFRIGHASYSAARDSGEVLVCAAELPANTSWVHAEAYVYLEEVQWNPWAMFEMHLMQKEKQYTNAQVLRPQRFIRETGSWQKVSWDLKIDRNMKADIKVTFRNIDASKNILVDDLRLYYYEEPTFSVWKQLPTPAQGQSRALATLE